MRPDIGGRIEGAGAVRDFVFHFRRKLGEGLVVAVRNKERIVAEAPFALRRRGDQAAAGAFRRGDDRAGRIGQRRVAGVVGCAVGALVARQPFEQEGVIALVGPAVGLIVSTTQSSETVRVS